jgi:hypothetical protein
MEPQFIAAVALGGAVGSVAPRFCSCEDCRWSIRMAEIQIGAEGAEGRRLRRPLVPM